MEKEELGKLQEVMQRCCDDWVNVLGLQWWSIVVEVTDDTTMDMIPSLQYDKYVAAAKIIMPTGDAWQKVYPNYWAPYNMEVHIIAQLLELMTPETKPMTRYYLARVLFGLKDRINGLQQAMQPQPQQDEVITPEPVDEAESN